MISFKEPNVPLLLTIRKTAALGILTEYALRLMQKRGELPCIKVGNRYYVNVDALIEKINAVGGKMDE